MHVNAFISLALASLAAAATSIVSPDGSCGVVGDVMYTCAGSGFGGCCSSSTGVCGYDATSCSVASGCDIAYGRCDPAGSTGPLPATNSSTSTGTTATSSPSGTALPVPQSTTSSGTDLPVPQSTTTSSGTILPIGQSTTSSGAVQPTGLGPGNSTVVNPSGTAPITVGPSALSPVATSVGPDGAIGTVAAADPNAVCYVFTRVHTVTYE